MSMGHRYYTDYIETDPHSNIQTGIQIRTVIDEYGTQVTDITQTTLRQTHIVTYRPVYRSELLWMSLRHRSQILHRLH